MLILADGRVGEKPAYDRVVPTLLSAAWPMIPPTGSWDFAPLVWAAVLLLAAGLVVGRVRWWGFPLALLAGLPCEQIAAHFGVWAGVAVVVMVSLVLATGSRVQRWGRGSGTP